MNYVYVVEDKDGVEAVVRVPKEKTLFWDGRHADKYASEAAAMRFARTALKGVAHVPEVLAVGVEPTTGLPFLCMEFVRGTSLRHVPETERERWAVRLVEVVQRLCEVSPPFEEVGGFGRAPLWFDGPVLAGGPWASMAAFVRAMLEWSAQQLAASHPAVSRQLEQAHESPLFQDTLAEHCTRLVVRHGDLSPDNVLVLEGSQQLCLIDWEWAGVYDERDVWLEVREVLAFLGAEPMWRQVCPVDSAALEAFDRLKEVFMGVAWSQALSESEREAEIEYLQENLERL